MNLRLYLARTGAEPDYVFSACHATGHRGSRLDAANERELDCWIRKALRRNRGKLLLNTQDFSKWGFRRNSQGRRE